MIYYTKNLNALNKKIMFHVCVNLVRTSIRIKKFYLSVHRFLLLHNVMEGQKPFYPCFFVHLGTLQSPDILVYFFLGPKRKMDWAREVYSNWNSPLERSNTMDQGKQPRIN